MGNHKEFQLTDLGIDLVKPTDKEEFLKSAKEAIENVELLDKLVSKLNSQEPSKDFWTSIVEITDADKSEAINKEGDI